MCTWTSVAHAHELPDGGRQCITLHARELVVFRLGDDVFAVHNQCPHAGLPLEEGHLRGRVLTCPYHGYAYRIDTGRNIDFPHEEPPARTFPARIHDQQVQVLMESNPPNPREHPKRTPAPADRPPSAEPPSAVPPDDEKTPRGYTDYQRENEAADDQPEGVEADPDSEV